MAGSWRLFSSLNVIVNLSLFARLHRKFTKICHCLSPGILAVVSLRWDIFRGSWNVEECCNIVALLNLFLIQGYHRFTIDQSGVNLVERWTSVAFINRIIKIGTFSFLLVDKSQVSSFYHIWCEVIRGWHRILWVIGDYIIGYEPTFIFTHIAFVFWVDHHTLRQVLFGWHVGFQRNLVGDESFLGVWPDFWMLRIVFNSSCLGQVIKLNTVVLLFKACILHIVTKRYTFHQKFFLYRTTENHRPG